MTVLTASVLSRAPLSCGLLHEVLYASAKPSQVLLRS